MESQLNQAGTFAAQNYADSFFREVPTDSRFLQVTHQKFPPTTSLDVDTIEFGLNRFSAANIYQIQNACLSLQIVIQKTKDNSVPDKDKNVAFANNCLHSAFETVRLKINDQLITISASCYPYKAYITNTLTYSTIAKNAQLQSEGYYADLSAHMEPSTNNSGWEERCKLLRKMDKSDGEYKPEGVRFFGRLQLDLMSCPTGLPPGTKVDLEVKELQ